MFNYFRSHEGSAFSWGLEKLRNFTVSGDSMSSDSLQRNLRGKGAVLVVFWRRSFFQNENTADDLPLGDEFCIICFLAPLFLMLLK